MGYYKIVASDLDGTLLNRFRQVSEENWQAVEKMTAQGTYFVPCTGRTLYEMDAEIRDNPYVRYIIHSDGAVVYDKQTDQRITACMPQKTAHTLFDILKDYEVLSVVRYQKNAYLDETLNTDAQYAYHHVGDYYSPVLQRVGIPKAHFDTFCRELDEVEMVNVFFHDESEFLECKERILKTGEFLIAPADKYMEIFYQAAGKGNALLRLADALGIDRAQTIGVGDSTNDLTLVQAAGLGLAMSNACEELKAVADRTICSNEEHAMKYILERIL